MAKQAKTSKLKDTRKPALAFRVAISGARKLPEVGSDARARIEAQIQDVLALVHAQLALVHETERARACYAQNTPARMVCLSPLADGADRVFARSALDLADKTRGSALEVELRVAIPFDADSYKATFGGVEGLDQTQSGHEFDRLLARAAAAPLVLDGKANEATVRHASYEAIGKMLARNCDLLVAVWDQAKRKTGDGGTGDIVDFALHNRIPIWWIDALGQSGPELWTGPTDPEATGLCESAVPALLQLVDEAVIPPLGEASNVEWFAENEADPLGALFGEKLVTNQNFWLCHSGIFGAIRRWSANTPTKADVALGYAPTQQKWRDSHLMLATCKFYKRDDFTNDRSLVAQLSGCYQHGYRTAYLLIYLSAAAALIFAVLGIGCYISEFIGSALELCALLLIAWLVIVSRRKGWHRRYLDYRLLSELVRPSRYLAPLAWNLPFSRMHEAVGSHRDAWISWLAIAYVRAEPLPHGVLAESLPHLKKQIAGRFIGSQIEFHIRRKLECLGANAFFGRVGAGLFCVTLFVVAVKLLIGLGGKFGWGIQQVLPHNRAIDELLYLLPLLPALAPPLSAAIFAMKTYEEFEPLAESSEAIIERLVLVRERIEHLDLAEPLASQKLAEAGRDAALVMMSEVSGWATMLRTKGIEAA